MAPEKKKFKGIYINVDNQTVTDIEFSGMDDIRALLKGWLELAHAWRNGDTLYVDEEGLLKKQTGGFIIRERMDQVLAGHGLITGREIGDTADTYPPTQNAKQIAAKVRFVRYT